LLFGYLVNNLLPMRAGELARAYVLGQRFSISKTAVLATIVVARVIDGLVIVAALASMLMVLPTPLWVHQMAVAGGTIFLGAMVVLTGVQRGQRYFVRWFNMLCSRLPQRWRAQGVALINNFGAGLTSFRSATNVLLYLLLTIMVWSTDILLFWLVMHAFNISLAIPFVVLLVAAVALSAVIPALPGSVGTYEFVVVNILTFLGVFAAPATAFAVGIHGLTWLTVNLSSAVCAFQVIGNFGPTHGLTLARKLRLSID
jgi:glycosyltransferase 2 family protein